MILDLHTHSKKSEDSRATVVGYLQWLLKKKDVLPIDGLVLLGYPLHPPGRPNQLRDAHLGAVRRPMLIVQGERDTFGTPAELKPVLARLRPTPSLHVIDGGDHSLKITRSDKRAQAAVYESVQQRIVGWMRDVITRQPETG